MYTTAWCGYCDRAKGAAPGASTPLREIRLDDDTAFRARLLDLSGRWTVPKILIDGTPIGGFTELRSSIAVGGSQELAAEAGGPIPTECP